MQMTNTASLKIISYDSIFIQIIKVYQQFIKNKMNNLAVKSHYHIKTVAKVDSNAQENLENSAHLIWPLQ